MWRGFCFWVRSPHQLRIVVSASRVPSNACLLDTRKCITVDQSPRCWVLRLQTRDVELYCFSRGYPNAKIPFSLIFENLERTDPDIGRKRAQYERTHDDIGLAFPSPCNCEVPASR